MLFSPPELIREAGRAFGACWLFDAPWAHPYWSQYALDLYDLTTPMPDHPPVLYFGGATHEFTLSALDPKSPVDVSQPASGQTLVRLWGPNQAYQFAAESDEAAVARLQGYVDLIERRELSPDTDDRPVWDRLFADGCSLINSIFDRGVAGTA